MVTRAEKPANVYSTLLAMQDQFEKELLQDKLRTRNQMGSTMYSTLSKSLIAPADSTPTPNHSKGFEDLALQYRLKTNSMMTPKETIKSPSHFKKSEYNSPKYLLSNDRHPKASFYNQTMAVNDAKDVF